MLRNTDDARDCLEEVFARVYRHRRAFDFQHKLSTWLYAIADNLARDCLRRRARQPEFVSLEDDSAEEGGSQLQETLLDSHFSPDEALQQAEEAQFLNEALNRLPDGLRKPVRLYAEEELSQLEIAVQLRCTVKTVEMRLYHARKRLHSFLGKKALSSERDSVPASVALSNS
jgi:RNA polymerase sigma-70 factor (ECF subfamily)